MFKIAYSSKIQIFVYMYINYVCMFIIKKLIRAIEKKN